MLNIYNPTNYLIWTWIFLVLRYKHLGVEAQSQHEVPICPLRCLCFRGTVRCMFVNLDSIPTIPRDTTILDVRFNRITQIAADSFTNLPNLTTLLLNNNIIEKVDEEAFNGLSNLQYLYLYKNRIHQLGPKTFEPTPNLEQLYLHYNYISDVHVSTFNNLRRLERLFLQNNKIERILPGTFDQLESIQRIRLDNNALICDCGAMPLAKLLVSHPEMQTTATCEQPSTLHGHPIASLKEHQLFCRKPTIMEEPDDMEMDYGSTAYFHCKVDGDPMPKVKWLHNRKEIHPLKEGRYSILNDGTLMIVNLQADDIGDYECVASSLVGETKSRAAKILQKTELQKLRPRFLQVPNDVNVAQGGIISLLCEATGAPYPSIYWLKNEKPMPDSTKYEVSSKGSILIKNALKSDEGIYSCVATNDMGSIATVAQVRVGVPPIWLVTPLEQTVVIGGTLELQCDASGAPEVVISWTHNGLPVVDSWRRSLTHGGRWLRTTLIRHEDEGEYGCRAQNSAGHLETFTNIKVVSGSEPIFTHGVSDYIANVYPGGPLRLSCSASGYPTPGILWRKNKLTVIENARISLLANGTLFIGSFDPETDVGLYECSAFNDHGFITAPSIRIDRNRIRVVGGERVENNVIVTALNQARREVEAAENRTLEYLFGNMSKTEVKSPVDLLRLGRFPRAYGRNIARSVEIYERAIQLINEHVSIMNFSLTGQFAADNILTTSQLDTLGRYSGCISHKKTRLNCLERKCFHDNYRTIDGTCNNWKEPLWGSSYTSFKRLLPAEYENGFNLPIGWNPSKLYNGHPKPSAREISNKIIATEQVTPDSDYTHMLMQWGQFLDHDLDHTLPSLSIESFGERVSCRRTCENVAPCFPIPVPPGDPRVRTRKCIEFTRSAAVCGSGVTSAFIDTIQQREQINQLTSFIDASQVYGSSDEEIRSLKSVTNTMNLRNGIYLFPNKPLMPFATDETPIDCRRDFRESDVGCFLGGDIRANEQLALLVMHTVWFRQHNFLASKLKGINPIWPNDVVFQEVRKIVGAQMQHITYAHWMPYIIGRKGMKMLGNYSGYDEHINPTIATEFATAALRFGHTLINPVLRRLDSKFETIREGDLPLRNAFFSPWRLVEEGGLDPVIRGLFFTSGKLRSASQLLNTQLTDELFSHAHLVALDLAAMNIQRGRDHGIKSYTYYRKLCNLSDVHSFDDLHKEVKSVQLRKKLKEVYGHVDNIDLWVGGVAEEPDDADARVGPTFRCILTDQFNRLRHGDRFWYENPSVFRQEQLVEIRKTSLARVLCDNGDALLRMRKDVFHMNSEIVNCDKVEDMDLTKWASNSAVFNSATCSAFPVERETDLPSPAP